MARLLLISGVMHNTTTSRSRRFLPALLALTAAMALFAPERASADAPAAIRGASTAVLAIRATTSFRVASTASPLELAPAPADRGFVSADLLRKATDVVNNGIRCGSAGGGNFYVHAKPQGFGGVLSIRYRR